MLIVTEGMQLFKDIVVIYFIRNMYKLKYTFSPYFGSVLSFQS